MIISLINDSKPASCFIRRIQLKYKTQLKKQKKGKKMKELYNDGKKE